MGFRLSNDGINTIAPFVKPELVVEFTQSDLMVLLEQDAPLFTSLSEHLKEILTNAPLGSMLGKYSPILTEIQNPISAQICFPLWRAHVSVTMLISKQEKQSLYERLTGNALIIEPHP